MGRRRTRSWRRSRGGGRLRRVLWVLLFLSKLQHRSIITTTHTVTRIRMVTRTTTRTELTATPCLNPARCSPSTLRLQVRSFCLLQLSDERADHYHLLQSQTASATRPIPSSLSATPSLLSSRTPSARLSSRSPSMRSSLATCSVRTCSQRRTYPSDRRRMSMDTPCDVRSLSQPCEPR